MRSCHCSDHQPTIWPLDRHEDLGFPSWLWNHPYSGNRPGTDWSKVDFSAIWCPINLA
jgi:hypothetical protein